MARKKRKTRKRRKTARQHRVALTSMIGTNSKSNLQKVGERLGRSKNFGISEYARKRKALHEVIR